MAISFGIAGTGWVAGEYLKWIDRHPNGKVAGVFSKDHTRAGSFLHSQQVEGKVYETFKEMVEDPGVDAIVLCSTPEVRPEQAMMAARNNKHVILEKPLSLELAGLRKMVEVFQSHEVCTAVGFVLRWNPLFDTIKSLIGQNALGDIFMAGIDYWHNIREGRPGSKRSFGGSSMLSAGCHAVDALRYFAGEVEEVTALSFKKSESGFEFDPNVLAVLKLKNGGMGKVSSLLQCESPYKFNIQLHGNKGTMMDNKLYTHLFPGQTDFAEIPTILPDSGDVSHHPFREMLAEFITAVENETPTRCSFSDAYRSMEVCFAIDQSIATGKTVKVSAL